MVAFLHAYRHHVFVSTDFLMLPIGSWGAHAYRHPFMHIVHINMLPMGNRFSQVGGCFHTCL